MSKLTMKHYVREYAPRMIEIQKKYTRLHQNATVVGEDVFNYPEFDNGKNILCAFDETGCLVGYTNLFPKLVSDDQAPELPHRIWFELKVDIDLPQVTMMKNQLFAALIQRAQEIAANLPGRQTFLCISKYSEETDDLEELMKQGFQQYESMYTMKRDLLYPISVTPTLEGVTVRQSKLATEEERRQYIHSYALSFPHSPMSLDWLEYFVQSPFWAVGTAIIAYDSDDRIAGSVLVYWNPEGDKTVGITEEVFVTPAWQGKGIAKYIVKEALLYLQTHGLTEAQLTVTAENNHALTVYITLGYEIVNEQFFLSLAV